MEHRAPLPTFLLSMWLLLPVTTIHAQSSSSVVLEPASIHLGNVGHGHKQILEFSLVNQTKGEITIDKIRPTCGCMKMLPHDLRMPLGPAESRIYRCEVSLGRGWGSFYKKIEVSVRGQGTLFLPVEAWFHPGFRISALEMVFATAVGLEIPESRRTIEIFNESGGPPPTITELRTEDPRWTVRLGKTLEDRSVIEVSASSEFARGRIVGKVHGKCNDLPFIIPLRGRAFQHVIHEPQAWNLNQINKTGFCQKTLKIRRADGKPVRVLSARVELSRSPAGLDVSVTPRSLDDGSVELRAYVAHPLPLKSGGLFGKITLQLDCADEKELVLDLLGLIRIGGTKP